METVMKIKIDLLDGSSLETDAPERTWMCLADRVKFQEHFGVNPASMASWGEMFDDDGNVNPDADLGGLREDYVVFFAWRELSRRLDGVPDFAALIDQVAECEIEAGPPTSGGTTTPPGNSQQ